MHFWEFFRRLGDLDATTMSTQALKILVTGDVDGQFKQLLSRINNIQKKNGKFDMLLCVGNFFSEDDSDWASYKDGSIKVPVPTFILGPTRPELTKYYGDVNGCDLCENVTYLGSKGTFTGSSGLQIAYLSGTQSDTNDQTHFTSQDANDLHLPLTSDSAKFKGIDLLLTNQWPSGVEKYAQAAESSNSQAHISSVISQLALVLRPRYHFSAAGEIHYERQPYRNHKVLSEGARHTTRFIALAQVGNLGKNKYLYAFNVVPMCHMEQTELIKQPPDVTECPYQRADTSQPMGKGQTHEDEGQQFFYDMNACRKRRGQNDGGPNAKREQRKPPQPTGPCWFCLSSPEVEKHLVISVGSQTYLALAKGPLVPDHLLILPIGHYQSVVTAPGDVLNEIEQYKTALRKMYKSKGKVPVFFERNFRTQHLQIQVIPVNSSMTADLMESFQDTAQNQKIELHEIPKLSDLKQIVPVGAPYFYAELPSGDKLLHRIKTFFPLQFGREALSGPELLDVTERVDWKNCKNTRQEEDEMVSSIRKLFKSFDFN